MHLFNKVQLVSALSSKVDNNEINGYKISEDFLYIKTSDDSVFYKIDRKSLSDDELVTLLKKDIGGDIIHFFKSEIRNVKILKVVSIK